MKSIWRALGSLIKGAKTREKKKTDRLKYSHPEAIVCLAQSSTFLNLHETKTPNNGIRSGHEEQLDAQWNLALSSKCFDAPVNNSRGQ